MIVAAWQRAWEHVTPFFVFAPDIRQAIYTTNVIESLNMQLRKIIKTRGHFPTDQAAINPFAILFGERFIVARG